ncbi:hypothetical protein ANN_04236 [Periplaneta americana]|uniref:Uncharacterized protein n=1 Tax=Periplaneta americana TaxID=6978 RepID=A0ABQ8T803_PERAM|nr:hypothetical protein ANN_04236 [Periplaneta americana]
MNSEHLKICASVASHDNIFEKYWSARGILYCQTRGIRKQQQHVNYGVRVIRVIIGCGLQAMLRPDSSSTAALDKMFSRNIASSPRPIRPDNSHSINAGRESLHSKVRFGKTSGHQHTVPSGWRLLSAEKTLHYGAFVAAGGYALYLFLLHDRAQHVAPLTLYPFQRVLTTTGLIYH